MGRSGCGGAAGTFSRGRAKSFGYGSLPSIDRPPARPCYLKAKPHGGSVVERMSRRLVGRVGLECGGAPEPGTPATIPRGTATVVGGADRGRAAVVDQSVELPDRLPWCSILAMGDCTLLRPDEPKSQVLKRSRGDHRLSRGTPLLCFQHDSATTHRLRSLTPRTDSQPAKQEPNGEAARSGAERSSKKRARTALNNCGASRNGA